MHLSAPLQLCDFVVQHKVGMYNKAIPVQMIF